MFSVRRTLQNGVKRAVWSQSQMDVDGGWVPSRSATMTSRSSLGSPATPRIQAARLRPDRFRVPRRPPADAMLR